MRNYYEKIRKSILQKIARRQVKVIRKVSKNICLKHILIINWNFSGPYSIISQ